MMWKCFPTGRKLRNAITMAMWSRTPMVMSVLAAAGDIPWRKMDATRPETGRYQGTSPALLARMAASISTSLQSTPMIMQRMKVPSHERVRRSFFCTTRK